MQNIMTFPDDRKTEGGYGRRAPFGEPLTSVGYSSLSGHLIKPQTTRFSTLRLEIPVD